MKQLANGHWKVITGVLTSVVLLLVGSVLTSANHISRADAQAMVDRGDQTVNDRLKRIENQLDILLGNKVGD